MRKSIYSTAGKMKREVHQSQVTGHQSLHLATENLVLRAERQGIDDIFYFPQRAQRSWKDKPEISPQNFKAAASEKPARLGRSERDCISIERAARHHVSSCKAPGIVFPERKQAASAKSATYQSKRFCPLRRRDVVKYAVTIREIRLCGRLKLANQPIFDLSRCISFPC